MLKVLVVDDEYIIREGLKTIINWNKYGFEVCGAAENGREGLLWIQKCKPDLVIVDIKMPVMDGLKMIEESKERGDDCKMIVLTAHSDFRFAQKSIELGIDSYILKPVEEEDLIEKIIKVKGQIENTIEKRQDIDNSIHLSRDKILEKFVTGNMDDSVAERYQKLHNLDFPWRCYQVGLIDAGRDNAIDRKLKSGIKSLIESYIYDNFYGYVFEIEGYIGIILRNISQLSLPRILKVLQEKVQCSFEIMVTISMGSPVDTLKSMTQSYEHACKLLEQKFLYGHKQVIISVEDTKTSIGADAALNTDIDMDSFLENLYQAIDVNNIVIINNMLEDMKNWLIRSRFEEEIVRVNYTNLYLSVISRLASGGETLKPFFTEKKDVLEEICRKSNLQELHGFIKFKLLSISDKLICSRPAGSMNRILDYIDRNYARDIKLENLACLFNYNSTYLGKLFKTQTGQFFNTYMDHIRIEKAKLLLKEGLKVYQVVERVGISDIDYFYKKFKKYTGVSPSAFKGKSE